MSADAEVMSILVKVYDFSGSIHAR